LLLGNTEAIEDLGIFVNISMIESTNAFRRFAGDKSWNQLSFQMQQQIRLAAILEQAYARYGDKLQNNVMTKQERLMEQLKEVKLNLSQAFLPIWDAILPALIRFSESLAWVTEQLARFFYAIRGWDYDERTRGIDETTDAIQDEGDAYDDLADSAKKARKEIAAFDRLNLLGFDSGSGSGGGGGKGGSGGPSPKPPGKGSDIEWPTPDVPPLPRLRLEFDPPNPPDAGIGAVATAVVNTMASLSAQIRAQWQQTLENLRVGVTAAAPAIVTAWQVMLDGLRINTQTALSLIGAEWQGALDSVRVSTQTALEIVQTAWQNALASMQDRIAATRPAIENEWSLIQAAARLTVTTMADVSAAWTQRLSEMLNALNVNRPLFESGWYQIRYAARLTVTTLADVSAAWTQRLREMNNVLNSVRPLLENGWWLIRNAIRLTIPALTDTQTSWQTAMQAMAASVTQMAATVATQIGHALNAINQLKSALSFDIKMPSLPSVSSLLPSGDAFQKTFQNLFGSQNIQAGLDLIKKEWNKPENQVGLTLMSLLSGGGAAAKGVQAGAKGLLELLKGWGIAVPAFAAGGVVSGPTLAMVGEYPGARTNPEVIAPLSELREMVGDNDEEIIWLQRIVQAIRETANRPVTISRNDIGRASVDYMNDEIRRGRNPLRL
jgi:hypothetical protein